MDALGGQPRARTYRAVFVALVTPNSNVLCGAQAKERLNTETAQQARHEAMHKQIVELVNAVGGLSAALEVYFVRWRHATC